MKTTIFCRFSQVFLILAAFLLVVGCSSETSTTPDNKITPLPDHWEAMLEPTHNQRAIWVNAVDDAWAVNEGGQIYHNDGSGWHIFHETSGGALTGIWGFGADDIYATGSQEFLHFDGTSWQPVEAASPLRLSELWGTPDGGLFGAGYGGAIGRWDGQKWEVMDSGTNSYICSLWGTGSDHVLALSLDGVLHRFDGKNWSVVEGTPPGVAHHIWTSGPDDIILMGTTHALRFDGKDWLEIPELDRLHFRNVWGSGPDDLYFVGDDFAHFDGQNWTFQDRTEKFSLSDVHGGPDGAVYAVGPLNEIWAFTESGWQNQVGAGLTQWFTDIWGVGDNDLFVTCGDYELYHWNGMDWSKQELPVRQPQPMAVWGSSPTDVHVVGFGESVLHFDGSQWTENFLDDTYGLADIWGTSATNVYAVGRQREGHGRIFHFDGISWTTLPEIWEKSLLAVGGRGPNDVFASMEDGGLLHFDGTAWTQVVVEDEFELHSLWVGEDEGFAVGANGKIKRLVGDSWVDMESGTQEYLSAVWGTGEGTAVAVGRDGVILHFDGKTWSVINTSYDETFNGVWGVPGGDIYTVGEFGVVLRCRL